jgi:acetyl-CoA acetyltransferase
MDVENFEKQINMFMDISKKLDFKLPDGETPPGEGRSIFMDAYAMGARWHMKTYGSTKKQLAVICSKNHFHGSLNPKAQYQEAMTVDEVMNARPVTYPLTVPMCAPVGDGAAAAILCSKGFLKKLKDARPVRIRASVLGSGTDRGMDGVDIGERLSKKAYETAGIGPADIDLAELHDATSYGELHQCEAMGFCHIGEGGILAESGATTLGGKLPVNTSGGLECRGHPIGASGLAQIYEVTEQLRGEAGKRQVEGARIGLTENGGGNLGVEEASMTIHILEKV